MLTPPTAEGGALRSQDLRTRATRSVWTAASSGWIRLRVPRFRTTHRPEPDANARRIIAYGMRNPFRFTTRPGTNELWIGDVGWNDWEEINRLRSRG